MCVHCVRGCVRVKQAREGGAHLLRCWEWPVGAPRSVKRAQNLLK